jgi:hypothetical protein
MPNPIYLPQNPRAIGNIIGPAAQQSSNFLWQMLGQNLQQKFLMQQQQQAASQREREIGLTGDEDRKTLLYKSMMGGSDKPVKAYRTPKGEIAYLPNNVAPPEGYIPYSKDTKENWRAVQMEDGSVLWIGRDKEPPRGSRPFAPPTVQFIGTDQQGNPLLMETKGQTPGKITSVPSGNQKVLPKTGRLSAEQQKVLVDLEAVNTSIQEVANAFNSEFVGPISGRAQNIKSKFMSTPEFTKFQKTLGQLRAVVYGLSGKQINESELEWLKEEILPQLTAPGPNFIATLRVLEDWVQSKHTASTKAFEEQGHIVGGPKSFKKFKLRAPREAELFLRKNPQYKEQFESKYGYLPEGM